jgi:hypothetical protein
LQVHNSSFSLSLLSLRQLTLLLLLADEGAREESERQETRRRGMRKKGVEAPREAAIREFLVFGNRLYKSRMSKRVILHQFLL